eukprot:7677245-Lingulodinium_polyedra.AAC.1
MRGRRSASSCRRTSSSTTPKSALTRTLRGALGAGRSCSYTAAGAGQGPSAAFASATRTTSTSSSRSTSRSSKADWGLLASASRKARAPATE